MAALHPRSFQPVQQLHRNLVRFFTPRPSPRLYGCGHFYSLAPQPQP